MTTGSWNISNMTEISKIKANMPVLFLLEKFSSMWPFIYRHHQTIKQQYRRNILWRRIEINMLSFRDSWTKRFLKIYHFLKVLDTFYYWICTGKLISVLFSFLFGFGNFVPFSLSYNRNNLSVNLLKLLCQQILFCKL